MQTLKATMRRTTRRPLGEYALTLKIGTRIKDRWLDCADDEFTYLAFDAVTVEETLAELEERRSTLASHVRVGELADNDKPKPA